MKPFLSTTTMSAIERWCWLAIFLWPLLALVITYFDRQDRWHTVGHESSYALKLWIYWLCFSGSAWLLLLWMHMLKARSWARRILMACAVCAVAIGVWSHTIEPNLLRVSHHTVSGAPAQAKPIKIALVSDIHWGLFGRDYQLQRLVSVLNEQQIDAIFVAGDWTYEPKRDMNKGFAPLAQLKSPVFAVLGNHDLQAPGPRIAAELSQALRSHGVQLVEGKRVEFQGWEIVGLDDLWGGNPQVQIQTLMQKPHAQRLVLTHQPDTAGLLPADAAFLTMAGHTHGGQIYLPRLTDRVLEAMTKNPWYEGMYDLPSGRLFVSAGVGMIGLPARLGVIPTIHILSLQP